MKCALVFYTARKTGYCETALAGGIAAVADIDCVIAAIDSALLEESVNRCLNKYNLLFVLGDINRSDNASLVSVMSKGFGGADKNVQAQRIINKDETAGYYVATKNKHIFLLDDNPDTIEKIASTKISDFIRGVTV